MAGASRLGPVNDSLYLPSVREDGVDTALEAFQRRQRASLSTVLVFYRGERSFFCKQWLRRWLAIPAIDRRLRLADVHLLFVSSQSQGKAYSVADQIAVRRPELDDRVFFFGDPEHLLVSHLAASAFARPVITNPDLHRAHGWVFDYGMVQPAIIAVAADASPLYEWTSKPSILNVAGKLDRPDPFEVWDAIERRLDRIRITKTRAARALAASAPAESDILAFTAAESEGDVPMQEKVPQATVQPPLSSSANVSVREAAVDDTIGASEGRSESELEIAFPRTSTDRQVVRDKGRPRSMAVSVAVQTERELFFVDQATDAPESDGTGAFSRQGENDNYTAPLSTTIDTLTSNVFENDALSKEEPDVSDGDIASTPVKEDVSSNLNVFASEVLAESSRARGDPTQEPLITPLGPGRSDAQPEKQGTRPASNEFADEFEDLHDRQVSTDGSGDEMDVRGAEFDDVEEDASTEDEFSSTESEDSECAVTGFAGSTHAARENGLGSSVEQRTRSGGVDFFESPEIGSKCRLTAGTLPEIRESSVPSIGLDHVETSLFHNGHSSVRTDDSSLANSLFFEASALSSGRRIPEEADDQKEGISDYLKELKDPEKKNYIVRKKTTRTVASGERIADGPTRLGVLKPELDRSTLNDAGTKRSVFGIVYGDLTNGYHSAGADVDAESFKSMDSQFEDADAHAELDQDGSTNAHDVVHKGTPIPQKGAPIETDSYHLGAPMKPHSAAVDTSPFADGDHDVSTHHDTPQKPSLTPQDEYEAYDEYVVCEFEVEELVEEYDSDSSPSKVYAPGTIVEVSHDDNSSTTASPGNQSAGGVVNMEDDLNATRVVDVRGSIRINETDGKPRVWKSSAEQTNRSGDGGTLVEADGHAAKAVANEPGVPTRTGPVGSVRNVLRKMTVPVLSVGRKTVSKQFPETAPHGTEDEVEDEGESDPAKVNRRDTIKAAFRRLPTSRHEKTHVSGFGMSGGQARAGSCEADRDGDEHAAKLGRKETLKSVLRKLPGSKNLKRSHQGPEASMHGPGDDVEMGMGARATCSGPETAKPASRKGGLQAVLKRLPSLSSSSRQREPPKIFTPLPEIREECEAPANGEAAATAGNGLGRSSDPQRSASHPSVIVTADGGARAPGGDERSATSGASVPGTGSKLRVVSSTSAPDYPEADTEQAKEVTKLESWAEEVVSTPGAQRSGDGASSEVAPTDWTLQRRGKLARTLSRLRGSGLGAEGGYVDSVDAAVTGAGTAVGVGRAEPQAEDGRKRVRWKAVEEGEEAEKVATKKSLTTVGGRILSRFRMA